MPEKVKERLLKLAKAQGSTTVRIKNDWALVFAIMLTGALFGFSIGCSKRASGEAITKDIQNRIAADPETKDSNVAVTAKEGKVTLTGTAQSQAAQQKLEQIAREEPGAAGLDDQISVAPPPQPIVVPAGTVLVVTLAQPLSSKTSHTGQTQYRYTEGVDRRWHSGRSQSKGQDQGRGAVGSHPHNDHGPIFSQEQWGTQAVWAPAASPAKYVPEPT